MRHFAGYFASAVILAAAVSVVGPAQAADPRSKAQLKIALKRIDTLGLQRMRTQRMTKAVCFSLMGIGSDEQDDAALIAVREFDYEMARFLRLAKKADAGRPEELHLAPMFKAPSDAARTLMASVKQLVAGDLNTVAMSLVLERNMPVLASLEGTVGRAEDLAVQAGADPDFVNTLNNAGRQRMLTQRIAKNVCLISSGFDPENSFDGLRDDIALFGQVLNALEHGDQKAGIMAAPTPLIATQLRQVRANWVSIRPTLENVLDDRAASPQLVAELGRETDNILTVMDRIVSLWVKQGR